MSLYFGSPSNALCALQLRIFSATPVALLTPSEGVSVLMYHHLAPEGSYAGTENEKNAAIISVEAFATQMEYLANEGYTSLFLSELIELLQAGSPMPAKCVAITFDDAYESVYVYALPILQSYGLKGTVAIIGEQIGRPAQGAYKPIMLTTLSRAQMEEMRQSGCFEFQSHSYALHRIVKINQHEDTGYAATSRIYLQEQSRRETAAEKLDRLSEDFITQEQKLASYGINANILLYPYGATDKALIDAARKAGIEAGFTVQTGKVRQGCDLYRLPRLTISSRDSMKSFIRKLNYGK